MIDYFCPISSDAPARNARRVRDARVDHGPQGADLGRACRADERA